MKEEIKQVAKEMNISLDEFIEKSEGIWGIETNETAETIIQQELGGIKRIYDYNRFSYAAYLALLAMEKGIMQRPEDGEFTIKVRPGKPGEKQ